MNKRAGFRFTALLVFVCITLNTRVYAIEQENNANASETMKIGASLQDNKDTEEKDEDISEKSNDNKEPESIQEDDKVNIDSIEEKPIENTLEVPKEPQEDETDPLEVEKIVQAKRISIYSINVINRTETNYVNIKQSPSLKSRTIGIIYGDLTAIKVIKKSGSYTFIEAVDYKTDKLVKGYVQSSQIKTRIPKKQYQIIVDISDQRVYVYNYENLEREMICSTGKGNTITPIGMYLIGKRGNSFYSNKYKQGGYNWVRFNYNFLFHSVPFNKNRVLIPEETQKLGQQASHGCVRLSMEDSKWFYQTIPEGSLLVVQQ